MTDKELLELAAKAAGIENIERMDVFGGFWYRKVFETDLTHWNPLADDGDALRLAVKLGLDINQEFMLVETSKYNFDTDTYVVFGVKEPINPDPYAATRRAIVRAAAEIGKDMK